MLAVSLSFCHWVFAENSLKGEILKASNVAAVVVSDEHRSVSVGEHMSIVEDLGGRLNLEDVEALTRWRPTQEAIPSFGLNEKSVWLRLKMINRSKQEKWLFELANPQIGSVNFYLKRAGGQLESFMSGMDLEFYRRPYVHRNIVFPIDISTNEKVELFARISSEQALRVPMYLWQEREFLRAENKKQLASGLFFGMALILIFYNMFMYIVLSDRSYLFFVIFVLAYTISFCVSSGVSFQYWWPNKPIWNQFSMVVVSSLMLSCLSMFFLFYLKTSKQWVEQILIGCGITGFGLVVLGFFIPGQWVLILNEIGLCTALAIGLYASFSDALKNAGLASRYAFSGILLFSLGVTVDNLVQYELLTSLWLAPNWVMPLSAISFMLLVSVSLTERIDQERKRRIKAQQETLDELSERKEAESNLIYRVLHDPLTGCPNRGLLLASLDGEIVKRKDGGVSLILIHLARFAEINNTIGQTFGAELLSSAAKRLCCLVAQMNHMIPIEPEAEDTKAFVSTMEGAIFGIICEEIDPVGLKLISDKLLQSINRPVEYQGMVLDINGHIGVASFPEHGGTAPQLMQRAMVALEIAQSKNISQLIYSTQIDPYSERRLSLAGDLRHAIQVDQLELHYQPQISLRDDSVIGFEALVRWIHPKYGFIPPDEFVVIAEQTGVIRHLTDWVMETAIVRVKEWVDKGFDIKVSVNLSAKNLEEHDLVDRVDLLLDQYGVKSDCLLFEITETAMMADPTQALKMLTAISDAGIGLSIDDFGTGYSSLAYLKRLPVGEIKIDRTFVIDMGNNTDDQVIVNTTLNMSHSLGMSVVAEGVENREVLNTLRRLGCDIAQGYYICKPTPGPAVDQWIKKAEYRVRTFEERVDEGQHRLSLPPGISKPDDRKEVS